MNNQEKFKDDLLRQYIYPERIEKAPEGFTANVMTRIQMETRPVLETIRTRNKNLIPVISAVVTVALIIAALLIPGSQTDPLAKPLIDVFNNIKITLPVKDVSSIFSSGLPSQLIYIIIGIFILTLFDRALYGVFHREK